MSFIKHESELYILKSKRKNLYTSKCLIIKVRCCTASSTLICKYFHIRSIFVKIVELLKNCDSFIMVRSKYLSGVTAWFTLVKFAHIWIATLTLCAMIMLHSKSAATICFQTPILIMRLIFSLTFGNWVNGTRRCVRITGVTKAL